MIVQISQGKQSLSVCPVAFPSSSARLGFAEQVVDIKEEFERMLAASSNRFDFKTQQRGFVVCNRSGPSELTRLNALWPAAGFSDTRLS